jgi:hypothetical protein
MRIACCISDSSSHEALQQLKSCKQADALTSPCPCLPPIPTRLQDITYQQGNRIKSISICGRCNPTFLSLDQSALHVFSRAPLDPDHIEVHHTKALQRPNFVSAVCHAVPAGLGAAGGIILAACLDCSLKAYAAEKLRLRSSMTWNCGIVTALLYNRCGAGRGLCRKADCMTCSSSGAPMPKGSLYDMQQQGHIELGHRHAMLCTSS